MTGDTTEELADFLQQHEDDAQIDDSAAQIGSRIAEARRLTGMSRKDVAAEFGVKQSTVRKWEEGRLSPRGDRLTKMAGSFGVSLSWLLIGHGMEPTANDVEVAEIKREIRQIRSQVVTVLEGLDALADRLDAVDEG
ncbi:MAG: helix-turn-helix domain-containing protein [Actinomycetia bacterium]|nr:helix-turn-helix domain-containing protein [Actinomycetes bacterium]MCP5028869.1 helix-turn-helix domain-containing protein [Actinomycetes bacterium]